MEKRGVARQWVKLRFDMKMFRQTWNQLSKRSKVVLFACIAVECIALTIIILGFTLQYAEPVAVPVKLLILAGAIGFGYCWLMWRDAHRMVERGLKIKNGECPDCSYSLEYVESRLEKTCSECGWSETKSKSVPNLYVASSPGELVAFAAVMWILYLVFLAWKDGIWYATVLGGTGLCVGLVLSVVTRYRLKKK